MVGFKGIKEYFGGVARAIKQAPVAFGIGLVIFGGVIVAAIVWLYNGGAEDHSNTALSLTEGKYVCVTVVPARKPDMRALLVEFGMSSRRSTGLAVKIITAGKLDFASHWEGPSLHTDRVASEGVGSSLGISEGLTDYSYRLQFNWPPVSPGASEYIYLEAEEQPVISDIFYLDNVYDARDDVRAGKTAYDYSACPR
jgi:hypothetical protein